jgi:hypothetical protein
MAALSKRRMPVAVLQQFVVQHSALSVISKSCSMVVSGGMACTTKAYADSVLFHDCRIS